MNAIKRWLRHFRYQLDEARAAISYPDIMLPPMTRHYDVRGIDEMHAYDSYLDELEKKKLELIREGRRLPARSVLPLHFQKQDLADYRPESLEDRALEIFKP